MSMGEITGYEDQWLNFSLNATDDDLIHGDRLKFSTNITTEMEGLTQGVNYEFNEESGEISILPDNDMVGSYWLEFEVNDFDDKSDSKTVNLVVNNVNDPPLPLISWPSHKQKYNTTTLINFDGTNSTDDDLIHGDILSYRWSSNITGVLSIMPKFSTNLTEVGWHKITLSVIDGSSMEAQEYIEIQIIPSKVPSDKKDKDDDGDDDKPLDDTKIPNKTGENEISASMIGSIIVIIIVILILISTFMWHRKKAKDKAKADIEEPNRTAIASVGPDLAGPSGPALPGTLPQMQWLGQPMLQPMPSTPEQLQQQQLQLLQQQQQLQLQLQQLQQQPIAQPLTLPPEAQPEIEPLTPSPTQPPDQSPQNQQNP
jgi:hypothetical protein